MLFKIAFLRDEWKTAHAQLGIPVSMDEFRFVISKYRGKGRYYHAVNHLVYGLRVINTLLKAEPFPFREIALLKMAFFYHDLIYDVTKKDNEEQSANCALVYLSHQVPEAPRIYDLIMATANHQGATLTDPLWPFMNDADLAVLGAPPKIYQRYARNVRLEYKAVPEDAFRAGRSKFLREFAAKPIFKTAVMLALEQPARKNLLDEAAALGG